MSSWGGGIILYRTYALYQDKHEYNVIKGVIPDFGYDVKFAIKVDGNKANEIPESQAKGSNGKFYKVEVNCDNNVDGEWDYNAWNVKLNGVVENSKCTLSFVSNMDATERDNLLKAGVTYRRNTYRGQDITKYKTGTTINGRDLYQQISDCTFDDIYVGDYILSNQTDSKGNKIKWLIADINNYLYAGDSLPVKQCHVTIIPEKSIKKGRMNPTDTTEGGYANSEMVTKILGKNLISGEDTILSKYIYPDFGNHVIKYSNYLTINNKTDASASAEYERYLDLMSEINVLGSVVASLSLHDTGIDNQQYAIFQLKPELIRLGSFYWLKGLYSSYDFVMIGGSSAPYATSAKNADGGIRPRFLID